MKEDCKDYAESTQNCIVKLKEQIAELRSAQEWVSVKDKMPDKSRWGGHIYAKTIRGQNDPENVTRLLQETCVAELIHWLLLVISPAVLLFAHGPMAVLVAALYGLSNFPFIMIQRYNRPRLRTLLKRCKRKEPELV